MQLNVAYYARVSTDKDDQINSLENQSKYFEDFINKNSKWNYCGAFIDEGITGTTTKNRKNFLQMIDIASSGKIDLILTKEVSRFARNTVDSLTYTDYLLSKGVIVYFLSDNINTLESDSEFRLTMMASLAQDEVRKLSERVKFGMSQSVKKGNILGGKLLGYEKIDNGYTIVDEEKVIIETLFNLYATGNYGLGAISKELAKKGYLTKKGKPYSTTSLRIILQNPKYKGYYTANKSYVKDYKTHKKIIKPKNEWLCYKDPRIPAIVSEELWDLCNELHDYRNSKKNKNVLSRQDYIEKSKYTSKFICAECGGVYFRCSGSTRKNNPNWCCRNYKTHGVKFCSAPILYENGLDRIMTDVISNIIGNKDKYLNMLLKIYEDTIKKSDVNINIESYKEKINHQNSMKDKLLEMSLSGLISDEEFKRRNDKFNEEIKKYENEIIALKIKQEDFSFYEKKVKSISDFLNSKYDVKENMKLFVNKLIKKVLVSKIDGDRKHVKLHIIFDFNYEDIDIDVMQEDSRKCCYKLEKAGSNVKSIFFAPSCSWQDAKQPRICRAWKSTW